MRHIFPTALALILPFSGCTAKPTQPTPPTLQKGWRPAGLVMTEQEITDGGVGEVTTSGPYILAMAGYGKLHLGKEGDTAWDSIPSPENEAVSAIFGDSQGFLCGLAKTGRIFALDPSTKHWTDLGFQRQDSMEVTVIQKWQTAYVAFFLNRLRDSVNQILSFSKTPGDQHAVAQIGNGHLTAFVASSLDTILLAGTADSGIFRYTVGDPVWRKLPPAYYQSSAFGAMEIRRPRSFAWLNHRLWVGQLLDGLLSTPSLDTAIQSYSPPDSLKGAIPVDLFALLAWRGRLFIGGSNPFQPMVLDPATNRLLPLRANFCMDAYGRNYVCPLLLGGTTWAFAATMDTLYAASGGQLLKIGYPDIPQ